MEDEGLDDPNPFEDFPFLPPPFPCTKLPTSMGAVPDIAAACARRTDSISVLRAIQVLIRLLLRITCWRNGPSGSWRMRVPIRMLSGKISCEMDWYLLISRSNGTSL